jgi:hypothetical protein
LANNIAKSFSGEVSLENGELAMVIMFKDWVLKHAIAQFFKSRFDSRCPEGTNRLSNFMLYNIVQWFSTDLKEGDESTIKLKEANKTCHLPNKFLLKS